MSNRLRILVVEDDQMQQRLLELTLQSKGYEVVSALDGAQAIERLEQEGPNFAMIILDLIMPDLDGVRFLQWLRGKAQLDLPVLVLSSKEESALEQAGDVGNTRFQRKPIDFGKLADLIGEILTPAAPA